MIIEIQQIATVCAGRYIASAAISVMPCLELSRMRTLRMVEFERGPT